MSIPRIHRSDRRLRTRLPSRVSRGQGAGRDRSFERETIGRSRRQIFGGGIAGGPDGARLLIKARDPTGGLLRLRELADAVEDELGGMALEGEAAQHDGRQQAGDRGGIDAPMEEEKLVPPLAQQRAAVRSAARGEQECGTGDQQQERRAQPQNERAGLEGRLQQHVVAVARDHVGEDLTKLFNRLSGFAPDSTFKALMVSPNGVRDGLVSRIDREIEHHKNGKPARISIKVNSLVDEQIIDALYRASQAGVSVDVLVRGMCSLRPGVKGLSETIRVRSVLGRYLEHSRIFAFAGGGDPAVFIGSADMMHRNLDRRVEALVRIIQPDQIKELLGLFELAMAEDSASWHLDSTGAWTRFARDAEGNRLVDVQDKIMADVLAKRGARK